MKNKGTVLFSILATFLLLLASVSWWFYNDVYNEKNFQNHVSTALQTQDSREAIAALIIDEGFKNRPVLKNLVSDQLGQVLAGALTGPRVQNIMDRLILRVHDVLFSPETKAIAIDITGIKNFISRLSQLVESATGEERQAVNIPDQIVLVREGEVPSIAPFGMTLLALGPISIIAGIALAAWLIWRTLDKVSVLKVLGGSLAVWSVVTILFTQWYKPLLVSSVGNPYARTIADQILGEFLKSLTNQNLLLLLFGLLLFVGGFVYNKYFFEKRVSSKKS